LHESSKHKALAQGIEKNIASPVLLLVTRQILDIYNTQINASLGGTTQVLVSPATLKRSLQTCGLQQKSATPTSTEQTTTRGQAEAARQIETYAFNIYGWAVEIPTDQGTMFFICLSAVNVELRVLDAAQAMITTFAATRAIYQATLAAVVTGERDDRADERVTTARVLTIFAIFAILVGGLSLARDL
jgi:hypothetical protein